MATVKILCALITVTLLFGEIRANEEPQSAKPTKYVPISSVLPSSLLFLLNRKPVEHRSMPARPALPSSPVPTLPTAPITPTSPSLPNSPVSPSIPSLPIRQLPRYPLPYRSGRVTPQYYSAPVNAVPSSSGQGLSYDNASGNRKLLNVVHIPFRGIPAQPKPVGALPLNYNDSENVPIFQQQPLPSNPNIIPLGALPLNDQRKTENTNNFNHTQAPLQNIGASTIPVDLNDSSNSDDPKKTITFNTSQKDIPNAHNIVPLGALPLNDQGKTGNSNTFNPEDLTPVPIDTIGASPIPVKPNDSSDANDSKNTITFNPKDIPYKPIQNIEASPIPIRPEIKNVSENTSPTDTEYLSPLPSDADTSSIPNQPENNTDGDASDIDNNNGGTSDNDNTLTINPKDLTPEPTDTIAASPIPVKPKNNQPPTLETSESTEPEADKSQGESNEEENDESSNQSESEDNEEPQNPLKDLVLNGSSSSEDANSFNPLGNVVLNGTSSQGNKNGESPNEPENPLKYSIVNGTSSQGNQNGESQNEPENPLKDSIVNGSASNVDENEDCVQDAAKSDENPLKDQIFNGSPQIQKSETESDESVVENSEPNQEYTESKSHEEKQENYDNGEGVQSSNTEEQDSEEQNVQNEEDSN